MAMTLQALRLADRAVVATRRLVWGRLTRAHLRLRSWESATDPASLRWAAETRAAALDGSLSEMVAAQPDLGQFLRDAGAPPT